ncbi:hypothetical protein K474DRAFT_1600893 [Panus rudis PR-1116 ss-1]|nr:hypothetical protein K474DRAFT_1600893 [Panus rudis PR-1116 ss-1]
MSSTPPLSRGPSTAGPASPGSNAFRGWIRTTRDALLMFEAARKGVIPRVTRRFHETEKRTLIKSGTVLIFTEEETGIKRWTDPFLWSASRMLGNFMIYREREDSEEITESPYACSDFRSSEAQSSAAPDLDLEKDVFGSWNKGKGLKPNGLMKKTVSLNVGGVVHHLISYYKPSDVFSGYLKTPSSTRFLSDLEIDTEVLVNISKLRQPPQVRMTTSGRLVYV